MAKNLTKEIKLAATDAVIETERAMKRAKRAHAEAQKVYYEVNGDDKQSVGSDGSVVNVTEVTTKVVPKNEVIAYALKTIPRFKQWLKRHTVVSTTKRMTISL